MPYEKELNFAKSLAIEAGNLIKSYFYKEVKAFSKGKRDIVTKVDKISESLIIKKINKIFPEHSILAEESGKHQKQSDYEWVIDPLDGTTNFKHHIPFFNVSIALKHKKDLVLGVVYAPLTNEIFYARKGSKAYLNNKTIKPSKEKELEKCFLGCCHSNSDQSISKFLCSLKTLKYKTRDIRKFGSAALEICYVAAGRLNAFLGIDVKPWDFSAAILIARQAGCKTRPLFNDAENNIFVSSPYIYNKLEPLIEKIERDYYEKKC
jgi:myo-inositol-1(or 4)-monophosphatase